MRSFKGGKVMQVEVVIERRLRSASSKKKETLVPGLRMAPLSRRLGGGFMWVDE